jgi:hypothetical protein
MVIYHYLILINGNSLEKVKHGYMSLFDYPVLGNMTF